MKKTWRVYVSILVIYLVIDVLYQAAFGLNRMSSLFEDAGIDDVMTDEPQYIWTVPIFFLVMAFVLLRVVVQPAIERGDVLSAFLNGALVGIASYGTLAAVFLWSVRDYPPAAAGFVMLEGLLFPTISSGVTAWLALRQSDTAASPDQLTTTG
ncbi:MAG: DUF2177 family protein [Actinomycetota bacterium]